MSNTINQETVVEKKLSEEPADHFVLATDSEPEDLSLISSPSNADSDEWLMLPEKARVATRVACTRYCVKALPGLGLGLRVGSTYTAENLILRCKADFQKISDLETLLTNKDVFEPVWSSPGKDVCITLEAVPANACFKVKAKPWLGLGLRVGSVYCAKDLAKWCNGDRSKLRRLELMLTDSNCEAFELLEGDQKAAEAAGETKKVQKIAGEDSAAEVPTNADGEEDEPAHQASTNPSERVVAPWLDLLVDSILTKETSKEVDAETGYVCSGKPEPHDAPTKIHTEIPPKVDINDAMPKPERSVMLKESRMNTEPGEEKKVVAATRVRSQKAPQPGSYLAAAAGSYLEAHAAATWQLQRVSRIPARHSNITEATQKKTMAEDVFDCQGLLVEHA